MHALTETKILQRATHTVELVMKEALSIRSAPDKVCFNQDSGYKLPVCWITTFNKLKGGARLNSAHPEEVAHDFGGMLFSVTCAICTVHVLLTQRVDLGCGGVYCGLMANSI